MAITKHKANRVFLYNGAKLPDPAPGQDIAQARRILAMTYPEVQTATIEGPTMRDGEVVYTIARAVGVKG